MRQARVRTRKGISRLLPGVGEAIGLQELPAQVLDLPPLLVCQADPRMRLVALPYDEECLPSGWQ